MPNLKPAYDAVFAADADLKAKAEEIAALLDQGADEETLALQEKALDELQAKRDGAKARYDKLVAANAPTSVAENFVPASSTPATPEAEAPKDVMTRAEYNALSPKDRLAFAKRGGKLQ